MGKTIVDVIVIILSSIFILCSYSPDSHESVGGAISTTTVKQLPRLASQDAKILLFCLSFFIFKNMTAIQSCFSSLHTGKSGAMCLSQEHHRKAREDFESRQCCSRPPSIAAKNYILFFLTPFA